MLLHGSAGSSVDMHPLALALQRAGITALVPDLRGHGANHPHGDIAYVGELDDAAPQSWTAVSTGRIIGLAIVDHFGVHWWDGLPVLEFPVPEDSDATTRTYSWRMQRNFGADDNYLADIRQAIRPVQVFVGGSDEILDAQALKAEFQSQRSDMPVTIISGLGHSDMLTQPDAIRTLVAALSDDRFREDHSAKRPPS